MTQTIGTNSKRAAASAAYSMLSWMNQAESEPHAQEKWRSSIP